MVRDPAETRERILAAAGECFSRFGLKKTTVDDVARVAGVGKGTVYLHFTDKDELFMAAARDRLRALNLAAAAGLDEEDGALRKLLRMLRNVIAFLDNDPLLAGVMREDPDVAPNRLLPFMSECQEDALSRIEELLNWGMATGEIAPVNTRLVAFTLFSSYRAYYFGPGERLATAEEFIATMDHLVRFGIAVRGQKEEKA